MSDKPEENATIETPGTPAETNATEAFEQQPKDTVDAPREARSVSSQAPAHEKARAFSSSTTPTGVPVRPAPNGKGKRSTPRARRMNLSLTRLNAWSVAKVSFLMSLAWGIIQIVAAALVWMLLNVVGVFDQLTQIVASTGLDAGGLNLTDVFSLSSVLSAVTIFSIIEIVLFTLLASVIALIYNVVSSLVGGVHITLGDD
ncbi:DUF3566 domain-containing protein [Bifidobacterium pongonis]|uniref:DUF3566 domain-containing protein n=1 Tax=Bifidobacterium pongonis TaxID=2834432 RepID=UPI001F4064F8|nr:DUF3566 domain-containing protein [Bifidobacterium pongonis]